MVSMKSLNGSNIPTELCWCLALMLSVCESLFHTYTLSTECIQANIEHECVSVSLVLVLNLICFFIHVKFITSVWKGRICITYVCVSFHRSFIRKRHALLWLLVLLAKTCTICLPLFEDSHFFFVLFCKIIIEDIQILNLRFPSPSKHPPPCLFAWFGRCAVSTNCLSGCWWVPLRFSLSIILTTTEHVHRPKQKACPQGYIYRCG